MNEEKKFGDLPETAYSSVENIKEDIRRHLIGGIGADPDKIDSFRCLKGVAYAARNQLIRSWIETQRSYYT